MSFSIGNRVLPPLDGSVTLPESLDFHAQYNPDETVFVFHEDGSPITHISYLEFRRACDRVAHKLRPGRRGEEGEIVAVLALSDTVLYHAVSIGMMRAGIIPFLMSPRNTAAAVVKMVKETSCHRLLTTQETLRPLITEVMDTITVDDPEYELVVEEMPPFHDIYPKLGCEKEEDTFEEYPKVQVRPELDDIAMFLHSSGSTGFPKSIPETFRILVHWAALPPPTDVGAYRPFITLGCMALPAFHTLGVISQLLHSTYALTPVSLYPPTALTPHSLPVMPTPDNILDHVRRTNSNALVSIPALLQIWAQNKESVSFLASLEFITYSGGSLPTKLGNVMTDAGVRLCPIYGGTEFGGTNRIFLKPDGEAAWEWVAFDERINVRMEPQGDGTYECQYLTCDEHQVSVENLPGEKGYATSDLFIPHPENPRFWKIVGRKDDVIIHSSGEKTVPAPMENIIMNSHYVMGVIIFGREHDQAGVLIELKPVYALEPTNPAELITGRNLIWPIIDEANKVAPAFSRIFKELILLTSPDKPLPRTGKGTVMRKAALALYENEIETLYSTIESTVRSDAVAPPLDWTVEAVQEWLIGQVEDIHSGKQFSASRDLFEQGMDSLSTTILRRRLVGALLDSPKTQKAAEYVSQNIIYNHPSIKKLSSLLVALINNPDTFLAAASRVDAIEDMIAKHSFGLDHPISDSTKVTNGHVNGVHGMRVLITGTTGNLGCQILETMLRDPSVNVVYALNRKGGSLTTTERQFIRFRDRALDTDLLLSKKLVFLDGDLAQRGLGIAHSEYEELQTNVDVIVHNAWKLDFNLSLASFEHNIRGTRNLIDLGRTSTHARTLKFLFTSSIASTMSWDKSRGPYPEEMILDSRFAVGNGYGESKYVSERLLALSGLQTTSLRIGQICGGQPSGAWAVTDWVPILIKSSIALKALPSMVGVSSWIPMDVVTQTILDVARAGTTESALNIVHTHPVPWDSLMVSINEALLNQDVLVKKLPLVPFEKWFSLLELHSTNASQYDLESIPAIKIVDFFRSMAQADLLLREEERSYEVESAGICTFSTTKAQTTSTAMKNIHGLSRQDADSWVNYWKGAGLFA